MINGLTVINIREYLSAKDNQELGETALKELLSEFSCIKNTDVERFLKEQAIEFTKKNQSVTYLVFSNSDAGGMVVFLEAENEEKLIAFYEKQNGFKRFDTKEIKSETKDSHMLIQFLRVL